MRWRFIISYALFSASGFVSFRATELTSIDLQGLGHAVFIEQSSNLCLSVPLGLPNFGGKADDDANIRPVQAWLLTTNGDSLLPSAKPIIVDTNSSTDSSGDYVLYQFPKVPLSDLAGAVVEVNGKFYCHEIENIASTPNGFQIFPENIANSPISIEFTNVDSSERVTVFYKADKDSEKFLDARLEVADAGSVIMSEPVQKIWTNNSVKFYFNSGYIRPFKFRIIDTTLGHDNTVPGTAGYWFFLRDFITNEPATAHPNQIQRDAEVRMGDIYIPGLSSPVFFTDQPAQLTVQMQVAAGRDTLPTLQVNKLHRQVWLLQADGTIIPSSKKPQVGGVGKGGFMSFDLIFAFSREVTNDVAGIAVSINGKLYCVKLPEEWTKP